MYAEELIGLVAGEDITHPETGEVIVGDREQVDGAAAGQLAELVEGGLVELLALGRSLYRVEGPTRRVWQPGQTPLAIATVEKGFIRRQVVVYAFWGELDQSLLDYYQTYDQAVAWIESVGNPYYFTEAEAAHIYWLEAQRQPWVFEQDAWAQWDLVTRRDGSIWGYYHTNDPDADGEADRDDFGQGVYATIVKEHLTPEAAAGRSYSDNGTHIVVRLDGVEVG